MDVPPQILKCVAFVGYRDKNEQERLAGTCVLLTRTTPYPDFNVLYVVTARHVIEGIKGRGGEPHLRVNLASSGVSPQPLPGPWQFHQDDAVDLAASCLTADGTDDAERWDHFALPWTVVEPDPVNGADPRHIAVGEDIFATGLFYQHSGTERNIPIVRLGGIAALPEEGVLVEVGAPGNPRTALAEAYLVEMHSQMGLSGSPVFIVQTREAFHRGLRLPGTLYTPRTNSPIYLLGLLTGHFDKKTAVLEDLTGEVAKANVGISVVVPYYKLVELFNGPNFQANECQVIKAYERERSATMDLHDEEKRD